MAHEESGRVSFWVSIFLDEQMLVICTVVGEGHRTSKFPQGGGLPKQTIALEIVRCFPRGSNWTWL